jgi:hypothetical protein
MEVFMMKRRIVLTLALVGTCQLSMGQGYLHSLGSTLAHYGAQAAQSPLKYGVIGATALTAAAYAAYKIHKAYQQSWHDHYAQQDKKALVEPKNPASAPVMMLFSHGLGQRKENAHMYRVYGKLPIPIESFDFPGSTNIGGATHLGQDGNIQTLVKNYQAWAQQGYNVILHGVSDGAGSTITTMGTHDLKNVKALILESPYDDIQEAVKTLLSHGNLHRIPGLTTLVTFITSYVCKGYSPYGVRPIDVAGKINKDIPILLIATKEDIITPLAGTVRLYNKLKAAGHTKVHLLILDKGRHADLLWGPQEDVYRNTMHAFLRHYGLPHNPAIALQSKHQDFIGTAPHVVYPTRTTRIPVRPLKIKRAIAPARNRMVRKSPYRAYPHRHYAAKPFKRAAH